MISEDSDLFSHRGTTMAKWENLLAPGYLREKGNEEINFGYQTISINVHTCQTHAKNFS